MYEKVLPNSIRFRNFLNDDILRYHEGHLVNCQMSRYLTARSRGPALSSAALISNERKDNCIGLVHLTNVDLREGEKMNDTEDENEMGIKEKKHKKLEPTTCKQQDELDLTAQTTNMIEEVGKKVKDKSIRRRILNWLNEVIHNYYEKKIAETYRREQEEGNQFYLCKVVNTIMNLYHFISPLTLCRFNMLLFPLCWSHVLLHPPNDPSWQRAAETGHLARPWQPEEADQEIFGLLLGGQA